MSDYLPYSGAHSIQEAVIAIHFLGRFSPDEVRQARDTARNELKNMLPRLNEHHQVQEIKIEQGRLSQASGEPRLMGFELSKVRADAKPARVLRLLENMLTVNLLEYRDWETTIKDSLSYVRIVASSLGLTTNPVQAFSLRYIDRYTYAGSSDEPHAGMLLRKDNVYMAPRCFKGGSLWHCHSGWFDTLYTGDRILNQLNTGSAIVDGVSTVTIDHNAICQLLAPRQSTDSLFDSSVGIKSGIESVLNRLHDENGNILRDMLLPEMLDNIGLQA